MYGLNFGFTVTGSGNPSDDGVGYGTVVTVAKAMQGNQAAQIKITPPTP
jgi:immune inhibitor A